MSVTADQFDDAYDDGEEGGLSGFYVLAIFLALLAVFAVVVYFAYQRGLANARLMDSDLPVVAANPAPVREDVPLTTETSRREVYDRLEGVTPTTVVADADPKRDPLEGYDQAPAATAPAEAKPEPAVRTAEATPAPVATAPATQKPAPAKVEPVKVAEAKPEPKPAAATPMPAKPAPAPAPAAAKGTHVVQVGAFGSDAEATRFFDTLSSKYGSFVSSKSPDIQVAEVKGTTYHRLRIGPFTSKSEAQSYCNDLKGRGQDCLVRGL
ncbi:SPOR domain-containing protein [Parvularcula dongshanensis]|uniref:Cell division septation protein DedD n=1 Tax=Parvularcula dongshanensis TaxID=1173995 RepID=A0A840I037_9PROT|nr:SPOR domain-containing protein [Parvularcula dongshanensis]MBB4657715.1 cell division septation protein DedD [Parvularcula dongshanensis]